ncbi:MAG TPA: acyltransferase, partial [Bacteroidia bacterium]|nr:acyltransferase [Bacteroidia bacterium]
MNKPAAELPGSGKDFLPQINLLRGIAAVMVAFYHFATFSGEKGDLLDSHNLVKVSGHFGCQGVYIFFVISGFVIPWSMYNGKYTLRKAGRFLAKRSLRIEPPYIVSFVLVILINVFLSKMWGGEYPVDPKRVAFHIGYLIPFVHSKYEWFNIVYWTLGIEFQYYLTMTLLFPLLNHSNRYVRYSVMLFFLFMPFLYGDAGFLPLFGPCFLVGFVIFLMKTDRMKWPEAIVFLAASLVMNYFFRDWEVMASTMFAFL